MIKFKEYESKPITRKAYEIVNTDVIESISESISCINKQLNFKHYENINVGDYIVYLDESDIYHVRKSIFEERNIV